MSTATDFLLWVRGPGFDFALVVFILGVIIRLLEVLVLGRKTDYADPRGGELGPGFLTVITRTLPESGSFKGSPFTVIGGYIWHIGFFISLFLFVPHIELIHNMTGLIWPGIPSNLVDAVAAVTIVTLVAMLFSRLTHPVKKYLSGPEDYLTWLVTFLPMLTGYLAYHRMIDPYPLALGLHILSVEVLMIVFPFTKLMHAFTFIIARWYNGAMAGRRGVQS
jgi:nitrate reductase gamma subunit